MSGKNETSKHLLMFSSSSNMQTHNLLPRVIYDRVRKSKNYFEVPAFLPIELGISRAGKFKVILHWDVFVFIWISRSWSSSFKIQNCSTFKIIFAVPYPIIYNPAITYRPKWSICKLHSTLSVVSPVQPFHGLSSIAIKYVSSLSNNCYFVKTWEIFVQYICVCLSQQLNPIQLRLKFSPKKFLG